MAWKLGARNTAVMDRYVNVDPRYGGDDAREFFSWLLQKL